MIPFVLATGSNPSVGEAAFAIIILLLIVAGAWNRTIE